DARADEIGVRDEVGDTLRSSVIEAPECRRDGAKYAAAERAEAAGLLEISLLQVPQITRRRVAVADVRNVGIDREALQDAGVRAEQKLAAAVHAQHPQRGGKKREQRFVTASALRNFLQKGI